MLQHMEDSWHTQNIQINKVIGENEFYLTEKTKQTFWPTQYKTYVAFLYTKNNQLEDKISFKRASQ